MTGSANVSSQVNATTEPGAAPTLDDSPVREWLDDGVSYHLAKVLGDDAIRPGLRLPLERALDELRDSIARWQSIRRYAPLSANPLFMLTLPFLIYGFLGFTKSAITGKPQRRVFIPPIYLWGWLGLMIFFWIFRNTPWYPFVS